MGEAVPATERDVLQILINTRGETFTIEDFDTESDPPAALVKFLKTREKEMRPGVKIYDDSGESTWTRYHGPLSVSSPGTLTNWNLGAHQQLAATARGQGYTELAHVAFKSSYFASKEVDTGYGKNPGEFGTAFYLTTGHEVEAQQEVSKVWKPADKDAPDDIVKFRIPNTLLSKLVGDDVGLRDFLIHILQHSHGYPLGMNEDAAVALMDRINAQGKVLIFPDDKDKKVVIKTGDAKKSWREYTEANAGPSGHYVIIGPQRPGALDNIRQIAFRGGMGQYLINSVARSLETISGAAPK
jgi:ATP-dependent Clp protease adapter protein ClpS